MSPNKKTEFKFYLQKDHSFDFQKKRHVLLSWRNMFMELPRFLWAVVFGTCFKVGLAVYKSALRLLKYLKDQVVSTAQSARQRFKLVNNLSFGRTVAIFLAVAIIGYGGLSTFHILARALEFKNRLVSIAVLGSQDLTDAKNALQGSDVNGAQAKFQTAYRTFTVGQTQLADENQGLMDLLNLLPQKQDSDKLFAAAKLLSAAGQNFTKAYQSLSGIDITATGLSSQGAGKVDLAGAKISIDTALGQINRAGALLEGVNANDLPASYREKMISLQQNYTLLQKAFTSLQDSINLAFNLLNGDKHLLLLMENNNELRPTGGFMGTFGDAHIVDGNLLSLNISSIYDLDGQLTKFIQPPFPVYQVNDRWFLRDSNWFADFPATAKKITHFYELEGGNTPDEIVAVTPTVMQNLLALTGPIDLPHYGVTLTQDNFIQTIQTESGVRPDQLDNKPKQILADLFPVVITRLGALPKDQFPQLLQVIQDSLNQKQLVMYSRDPDTEAQINSYNWGGGILDSNRDYLAVISANLNGSKTDLFLKQSLSLKTNIDDKGNITDQLTITKTNTMPDSPSSTNSSFIRIMVPQGSLLVSNLGFDYNTSTPLLLRAGFQMDPDVADWENSIMKDFVSGTSIGSEAGKTFFGNWLTVKGGETKTVTLTYKLPFKLKDPDQFSLLAQKQIGALPSDFSYEVDFNSRHVLWQAFSPDNLQADNFTYNFSLDKDYLLGEVFGN